MLAEAELPESREILVIAQYQHRELVRAIERREGARAERIGREHARLASRNLDVVLDHREVLESIPGASLVALPESRPARPHGRRCIQRPAAVYNGSRQASSQALIGRWRHSSARLTRSRTCRSSGRSAS